MVQEPEEPLSRSLIPSPRQWERWTLPSKHTTLGLLVGILAIVITLVLGVPPFVEWLKTKYPRTIPPPIPQYGFISLPQRYAEGIMIAGRPWLHSYSLHNFSVINTSDNTAIEDVRLFLLFPAGIVSHKFMTMVGCQDVVASQYNPPGGFSRSDGVIYKLREDYRNDLMISVARIGPNGRLTVEFILEYRGGNDDAGWCELNYRYGPTPLLSQAIRNRMIVAQTNPLSLRLDVSTNLSNQTVQQQIIVMSDSPINYNGVLMHSFDIEYTAKPNETVQSQ